MNIYKIAQIENTKEDAYIEDVETSIDSDFYGKIKEQIYTSLKPEEIEIFRMVEEGNYSFKEIGEKFERSYTWASTYYDRAIRKLWRVFGGQFDNISKNEFVSIVKSVLVDDKALEKSYQSQENIRHRDTIDSLKRKKIKIQQTIDYYTPMFEKWQREVASIDNQLKQTRSLIK